VAVTVDELYESRETTQGPNPSQRRSYLIRGTTDENTAVEALADALDLVTVDTPGRSLVLQDYDLRRVGWEAFEGEANYGAVSRKSKAEKDTGESEYAWDTTGGTAQIFEALEQKGYPDNADTPNMGNAINVQGDPPTAKGVQIPVPIFKWVETHYIDQNDMTAVYRDKLYRLTGKTNDAPWRAFGTEEVLFLGASGKERGAADVAVAYHFAAQPTTAVFIGENILIPEKPGWRYVWPLYQPEVDEAAGHLVPVPVAAYLAQTHETADFSELGITDPNQ